MDYMNMATIFINLFFATVIIFSGHKNPSFTWAWLLLLFIFPYFGFFLYLVIGMNGGRLRIFQKKAIRDKIINTKTHRATFPGLNYIRLNDDILLTSQFIRNEEYNNFEDLARLNHTMDDAHYIENNTIKIYNSGEEKFADLMKDIEKAKTFIHLEYYIVRDDNISNKLINALAKKARAGVEVKFLMDRMGTYLVNKKNFKRIIKGGGDIAYFEGPIVTNLNYRNHRKLAVIDGKVGYVGGLNVGDEYLGKVKRFGNWRDSHIRINGDSVKDLEIRFMKDWNFSSANKVKMIERYFPKIKKLKDTMAIQIVSSGPDTKNDNILAAFLKMINSAKKSIYIVTPYFVPNESLIDALKIASLSGVKITILIPANPDHLFVYNASISYIRDLINYDIKCCEYEKGFIHAKLLIVDEFMVSIGSANMDIRSFSLNFEVNSFIYDVNTAKKFIEQIEEDMLDSREITKKWLNQRSVFRLLEEAASKLISPLL
ncbi:MAG: cardiolipin synthase [Lachnospirales bacterium]